VLKMKETRKSDGSPQVIGKIGESEEGAHRMKDTEVGTANFGALFQTEKKNSIKRGQSAKEKRGGARYYRKSNRHNLNRGKGTGGKKFNLKTNRNLQCGGWGGWVVWGVETK